MPRVPLLAALVVLALLAAGCAVPIPGVPQGDNTNPGQRHGDYLHAKPYGSIVLELHAVSGAGPDGAALSLVTQRLGDVTGKPVTVQQGAPVPGEGASHLYSLDEIAALEKQVRTGYSGGDHAVYFLMYLDGGLQGDTSSQKTLGAAYRGSAAVMFKANMQFASTRTLSNPLPASESAIESTVLVHETGHILGLVNLGTPMVSPHEDASHPGHSNNQCDVMYWAAETSSLNSLLSGCGGNLPNDYDSADRADLQAERARG